LSARATDDGVEIEPNEMNLAILKWMEMLW
jgi:hypothetical protein